MPSCGQPLQGGEIERELLQRITLHKCIQCATGVLSKGSMVKCDTVTVHVVACIAQSKLCMVYCRVMASLEGFSVEPHGPIVYDSEPAMHPKVERWACGVPALYSGSNRLE